MPPDGAPPTGPDHPEPRRRPSPRAAAATAAALLLIAGALIVLVDRGSSSGPVLLEPIGSAGPDPFSDSVAPQPTASLLDFAEHGAPEGIPDPGTETSPPTSTPDPTDDEPTPPDETIDPDQPDQTIDPDGPDQPADPDDPIDPDGPDQPAEPDETTTTTTTSTTTSTTTTSTTTTTTTVPDPDPTEPERRGDYQAADGGEVGLYGGSLNSASCDVDQLVDFLVGEPDKGAAWAEVQGIDAADIPAYMDGLTPVNLGADTRVINHGFVDGAATPREAVLQRGTAVLVDDNGVPRAKCDCGNPLTAPEPAADESYTGDGWPAFEPTEVLVVDAADDPLDAFELVDVESGEQFSRPVGTNGDADRGRPTTTPIDFDTGYSERLDTPGAVVVYTITAPDNATVTLTMNNDPGAAGTVQAVLRPADPGGPPAVTLTLPPGAEASETLHFGPGERVPLELEVSGGPATYGFRLALTTGTEPDPDAAAGPLPTPESPGGGPTGATRSDETTDPGGTTATQPTTTTQPTTAGRPTATTTTQPTTAGRPTATTTTTTTPPPPTAPPPTTTTTTTAPIVW